MRNNIDLLIIVVLALLLVPLVIYTTGALRTGVGLAFVLFFPGYTLSAALFPRRGNLGGVERLALSFGLSIVVVPLIGLALNFTPWGIRRNSILISLLSLIVVLAAIAWLRGRGLPPDKRSTVWVGLRLPSMSHSWASQAPWDKILTVLLVLLIIGAIGTLGYTMSKPKAGEMFTEFYILDREGKVDNYPRVVIVGQSAEITVGIVNHERGTTTYKIEITIDGERVGVIGPISLNREESWERVLAFTPTKEDHNQKVEFVLYEGAGSGPYRTLRLWLDVTKAP